MIAREVGDPQPAKVRIDRRESIRLAESIASVAEVGGLMRRILIAVLIALASCASARAQMMPFIDITPPPSWTVPKHYWTCFVGCTAPTALRSDGWINLTPDEEDPFDILDRIWNTIFFQRARTTLRSDGRINLSPKRRPFWVRMFDNWPVGWLLPQPSKTWRLDGTADISPFPKTVMYAGGIDGWRNGAFAYGAFLWSPGGLNAEGITLKLMNGHGAYRYNSGALEGAEVFGVQQLTSILLGWRFKKGGFEATVFAGADAQVNTLSQFDPGNFLVGSRYGARFGLDVWHQTRPGEMIQANVSWSSIGPSYSARIAAGWWSFNSVWLGPELQNFGNPTYGSPSYMQWRVGAHATAFEIRHFEFSFGAGYVADSDNRHGAYGRFSLIGRI
nr:cellulose biosynthesis protein BcsS [Variibacter gotjawalensis]